jgi:hypothetical protein
MLYICMYMYVYINYVYVRGSGFGISNRGFESARGCKVLAVVECNADVSQLT